MKRRRDCYASEGNTCSLMIQGHCFNRSLGCKKCSREGFVSVAAAVVRCRPCRWDTVAAAATAIIATCSIVAAFAPNALVVNLEYRSGYRYRCARTRSREETFGGVWDGASPRTFGTSSHLFGGRNSHVLVKRVMASADASKCRLSLASVVEQTSTRDSAANASKSVSGGKRRHLRRPDD